MNIIKTTIKEEYGKSGSLYATIIENDIEVGFINAMGIYLRLYNPGTSYGVLWRVTTPDIVMDVTDYIKFVVKHWSAIFDRYDLLIKH